MTEDKPAFDALAFRQACGGFGTGVVVVSTYSGGEAHAMTANAFMSISLDPPLIAISIASTAKMLGRVRTSGAFSVSVLREGMEGIASHFAGRQSEEILVSLDEFDGLPVIRNAASLLVAKVCNEVVAGDHVIFIGHVRALHCDTDARPLLFHSGRFNSLAAVVAAEARPAPG